MFTETEQLNETAIVRIDYYNSHTRQLPSAEVEKELFALINLPYTSY